MEEINPYVMKIIISARKEDNINSISKRIKLSYGWTHYWIAKLIKIGVFKRKGKRLILDEKNKFYKETICYIKKLFSNNIRFYYNCLNLFGIKYCFTGIDSVFVWTKGGYNILRNRDYYPIFIKLKEEEFEVFRFYCKKIGLNIEKGKVFYKVKILPDFKYEIFEGIQVEPLKEVVKFMEKYKYNFQPALEMIKEMFQVSIKEKYREVNYV